MTDHRNDPEVVALIEAIVERVRGDGQLVTVNKHYPTGRAAFWLGFNMTAGAIICGGALMWIARFVHWVGGLF